VHIKYVVLSGFSKKYILTLISLADFIIATHGRASYENLREFIVGYVQAMVYITPNYE
jgi:hypothetical protein